MAEFILNRNLTIRSLSGHSVQFLKGIPTYVPKPCVVEALALGAERVDDEQGADFEAEPVIKVDPVGEERKLLVFECFNDLIAKNAREDFTAQGAPHIKAIRAAVGFGLDNKERDLLWAAYRVMKGAEE